MVMAHLSTTTGASSSPLSTRRNMAFAVSCVILGLASVTGCPLSSSLPAPYSSISIYSIACTAHDLMPIFPNAHVKNTNALQEVTGADCLGTFVSSSGSFLNTNGSSSIFLMQAVSPGPSLVDAVEGVLAKAGSYTFDVWQLGDVAQGGWFRLTHRGKSRVGEVGGQPPLWCIPMFAQAALAML